MGYTPPDEELDVPVHELQEAIKKTREAMMTRIRSNSYTELHVAKLTGLVVELTELEIKLIKLGQ